jgi:hypothetical protein
MLPLWIIDLRAQSDRRDNFQRLLGQIDHVYSDSVVKEEPDASSSITDVGDEKEKSEGGIAVVSSDSSRSIKEQFEEIDKKEALINSRIIGDYWCYTPMAERFTEKIENYTFCDEDISETQKEAEKLYQFQSELVSSGQQFIRELRTSNVAPNMTINIVVLGDITEDFTRLVFPAVAGIIQKEKERIIPHHIHQGLEIVGMLYIPSDINTLNVGIRSEMQRTLNEIEVQHQISDIRGYDFMMLYQDVQNRTECAYTRLSDNQLAEYLIQCISHLYLACSESHPLIKGTAIEDFFYFSMGATSVYFDTDNEDLKCRYKIAMELISSLKSLGDAEKATNQFNIIEDNQFSPDEFFEYDNLSNIQNDDFIIDQPSPHPVRNFLSKYLKRYYYNLYLRFFTTNLMQQIVSSIDKATQKTLESIAATTRRKFADAQTFIFNKIHDLLGQISANDGGIPTIVRLFNEMRDNLSLRRKDIQGVLEQKYWRNIEEFHIEKNLEDYFMEYHDAYQSDVKGRKNSQTQNELKRQAVKELNGILSTESTILSRICRSILLGIVLSLVLIPILETLSPGVIDLGDVDKYSYFWYVGIFLIPALLQLVSYFRYGRKKRNAVNKLKAMYLHDAYARVANRIDSEINNFYDKLIELGEQYIKRCDAIQREIGIDYDVDKLGKPLIPESMFNQPLIAGKFGEFSLLPPNKADDAQVLVNYIRYELSDLTKTEYFLMINQHKDLFSGLFRDVALTVNLVRRVNDKGEEELLTKQEQENELQNLWHEHKEEFYSELKAAVANSLLPRIDATIGEKLYHYCINTPDLSNVLKPAIAYAAVNGELVSSADVEFADLKINDSRVKDNIRPFIATPWCQVQIDKYSKVYSKYIFISRLKCFTHLNLNRILPTEDFDEKVRRQRVYNEEIKAKKDLNNKEDEYMQITESSYTPYPSSLLLWALCPDDSSSEWFKLFDTNFFSEAYKDKNEYRRILNQDD